MHSRSHEQTLGLPLWPFVGIGVAPATRAFEPGRGGLDLAATTAAREGGHYAGAFAGMTTGPREDGGHAKAIPAGTPTTGTVPTRSRQRRVAFRPWPLRRQAGVY
jgi:hypothetical protein